MPLRVIALLLLFSLTACNTDGGSGGGSGSGGGGGGSAATPVPVTITITPANPTIAVTNSVSFSSSGGTAPYTYTVVSGGGSFAGATYTAPAGAGSATIRSTDSQNHTATTVVTINPALAISPAAPTLAVGNSQTFSTTGGVGAVTYSVLAGGGSLNGAIYTAPGTSGTATIRATDSLSNTSDATVTVNPALAITPTVPTIMINGTQTFSTTGGVGSKTYSVLSGGGSFAANVYTAPASGGVATVRVTDSLGNTASTSVNISDLTILPLSTVLAVTNTRTFTTIDGVGPYTYTVVTGGGSFAGAVYTAPGTAGSATVKVTDSAGKIAYASITINPALAIGPVTPSVIIGNTLSFSSTGGVPPITYSVVSGGGSFSGATYTAPGSTGVATVKATDSLMNTSTTTVRLTPSVTWAQQLGQAGKEMYFFLGFAIDGSGNSFVGGKTNGNLASCGGVSSNCSGTASGTQDYMLTKYDPAGSWLWTTQLGQVDKTTGGSKVATDANGNVFIAGTTTGNLPSCGGVSASCSGAATGAGDYFISKYNAAGSWLWTAQLGQPGVTTYGIALATDSSGNVFVGGTTSGNLSSCGGNPNNCSGAAAGTSDYFISKYDASGTWKWTVQLGQTGRPTHGWAVATDGGGNVYISGYTMGNLVSCNGVSGACSGSSRGSGDFYLSKYSAAGAWQWTTQLGAPSTWTYGQSIATDTVGNVLLAGYTSGNLLSCSGVLANCTGYATGSVDDYFVLKYDTNGTWQWTAQLGEAGKSTLGLAVTTDSNNNVFIGGYTSGNLPSCNGTSANCSGSSQGSGDDFFISQYASNGTYRWTTQLGETGKANYGGMGLATSGTALYIGGQTTGNMVSCGGISANCSGSSAGVRDNFVIKYQY